MKNALRAAVPRFRLYRDEGESKWAPVGANFSAFPCYAPSQYPAQPHDRVRLASHLGNSRFAFGVGETHLAQARSSVQLIVLLMTHVNQVLHVSA